jgi:hypothetical protein
MRHRSYGPDERPQIEALPGFGPPESRDYWWAHHYTTEEWTDLMRSSSEHRMLPDDQRERLLAGVSAAIDRHGGEFKHPYCTTLWIAQRH